MASSLSLPQSSSFHPANHETLFYEILVVGSTIAAYTATLAILQAGGQVCWVQPDKLDLAIDLEQAPPLPSQRPIFNWRLGRRASTWETTGVLSRSQQQFWANWSPGPAAIGTATPASPLAPSVPSIAERTRLQRAIAPYLSSRQLIVMAQAVPVQVLYAENRGQRRVYQVTFQDRQTQTRFRVHAKLTLEATREGRLKSLLAATSESEAIAELTLTPEHLAPAQPRQARGAWFEDAITLMLAEFPASRRPAPVSIPLRTLIPQKTTGLLWVSHPGCVAALQPLFQQAKVQWALGEAAGHVAAIAVAAGGLSQLLARPRWQWHLQQRLVQQGIPIFAFDDVSLEDPDFEPIQMVAIADVVRTMRDRDLSFRPETPITRSVVASALARLPQQPLPSTTPADNLQDVSHNHWAFTDIHQAIALNLMAPQGADTFAPSQVLSKNQLWALLRPLCPTSLRSPPFPLADTPARRRHLSRGLYPILQSRLSS